MKFDKGLTAKAAKAAKVKRKGRRGLLASLGPYGVIVNPEIALLSLRMVRREIFNSK